MRIVLSVGLIIVVPGASQDVTSVVFPSDTYGGLKSIRCGPSSEVLCSTGVIIFGHQMVTVGHLALGQQMETAEYSRSGQQMGTKKHSLSGQHVKSVLYFKAMSYMTVTCEERALF